MQFDFERYKYTFFPYKQIIKSPPSHFFCHHLFVPIDFVTLAADSKYN